MDDTAPRPSMAKATIAMAIIAVGVAGYASWYAWQQKERIDSARDKHSRITEELMGFSQAQSDHQKQMKSVVSDLDALRKATASAQAELEQTNKRIADLNARIDALGKQ